MRVTPSHPIGICLFALCSVLAFVSLSASAATPLQPYPVEPDAFLPLLDLRDAGAQDYIVQDRLISPGEIPQSRLANTPGLNANQRAIASSLDKIDNRILHRGYRYLTPPLSQLLSYHWAIRDYFERVTVTLPRSHNPPGSGQGSLPPPLRLTFLVIPPASYQAFFSPDYFKSAYGAKDAGILSQTLQLYGPLNEALDRLSPEQLVAMQSLTLSFANEQSLSLEGRLAQIRGDHQFSSLSSSPASDGKSSPPAVAAHDRWGTFADGSGDFVDVESTSQARGYNYTQGTATLGAYYHFSSSFTAGLAVSYAGSNASLAANNGKIDANSMQASLFGTWAHGGLHLDAIAGGGYNSFDIDTHFGVERSGSALRPLAVHASTDGGFGDGFLGAGYDFHCGQLVFGPTLSLEYAHATINSFSENAYNTPASSGVANLAGVNKRAAEKLVNPVLKVMPQDADSLKTSLGWGASLPLDLGSLRLTPHVNASWQHEYLDQQYAINAAFPFAPNAPFTVHGPEIGRDLLLLQAGATLRLGQRLSIYADYHGMLARQNYRAHAVEGGARISF